MFKVGDKVILNPDKDEYTYGKGTVLYTDVGEITAMLDNNNISVYFPNNPDWWGKEDDLILFIEMKSDIEIPEGGVPLSCTITDDSVLKTVPEDYHWCLHNPMLDNDTLDYVQTDINLCKQYDEIFNKEREEKDMNKVLKLYYDRKREEINKKYEEKVDNDFNNIDVVKQYKTLIENFEKEQEALFKTVENFDNDYLTLVSDVNCYKYRLNTIAIKKELQDKYNNEYEEEINSLNEIRDEVDAQLSLSDDLNYQMEVLTRYDILDKKTNKVKA